MKNLPSSAIPVPKIEEDCYDWFARHAAIRKLVSENRYDTVFIGDSITHFFQGEPGKAEYGTEVWREYFSGYRILNLGYGFDRTQNVLWRLDHGELAGEQPRLIVVNIGTNQFTVTPKHPCDTPEDAAFGVETLLRKLRSMCPDAKLVVMAVFPRAPEEFFSPLIHPLNSLVKTFVSTLDNAVFLDLESEFRNPDGSFHPELYTDRCCHPNSSGYRIWAEALLPYLKEAAR